MEKVVGPARRNVGPLARLASAAAGAWMVWTGLHRTPLIGTPAVAAGVALIFRGMSGHCPISAGLGAQAGDADDRRADLPLRVEQSIVVMRPVQELYAMWRDLSRLPRFMRHLESVTVIDDLRSRWVARGPAGTRVTWDAVIVRDEPGVSLGWRSLGDEPGMDPAPPGVMRVDHAGSVRFRPLRSGGGTAVTVVLRYRPAGGVLGAAVAQFLGEDPDRQIGEDLARFRDLAEHRALSPA